MNLEISNFIIRVVTHQQLEMHGCILTTVGTDALVLKHQVISIQSASSKFIVLDKFHVKDNIYSQQHQKIISHLKKKYIYIQVFKG